MTAELHTLTGAYAVDALSDAERAGFEQHLDRCPACRQEVAELQATAARLAVAVEEEPPARLRKRVLDSVSGTRQRPPRVRPGHHARTPGPVWLGWLAASAATVVALLAGAHALSADRQVEALRENRTAVESVLTAPDAQSLTDGNSPAARVIASRTRGRAVVLGAGLPALDARHVYQVWVLGPGLVRSAGLLEVRPVVAPLAADADRVAITVEPSGGSATPTAPAVSRVSLT